MWREGRERERAISSNEEEIGRRNNRREWEINSQREGIMGDEIQKMRNKSNKTKLSGRRKENV